MNKNMVKIVVFLVLAANAIAQVAVDVNLNVRHEVGGISEFDREKYIVLHAGLRDNDWDSPSQRSSFLNDYDVYLGRNNGTMPWNLSQTTEDPANPGWVNQASMQTRGNSAKSSYGNDTAAQALEFRNNNMMIGGQMSMYPNGQTNGKGFALADYDALADYFTKYYTYFHGNGGTTGQPKPAMVEVVNEPFVKQWSYGTTAEKISEMHNVVAEQMEAVHPDIMVGGYTAAHPAYESGGFNHWDNNWRLFIDIAGTNMDFFSLHLYDYLNKDVTTNAAMTQYRSGSNVEAILDMVEHYSMIKLGEVKPFAISEFGAFEPKDGGEPWSAENDWSDIRSYSTILLQLLERPDHMLQAMPFTILKAEWGRDSETGNPYGPRLLRQKFENPDETGTAWVYTERIKFFELWKEVNGTRVDTIASDPDIQVDAYVDGASAFVIVSSLDHTGPQTVDLNLLGTFQPLDEIQVKHCYADTDGIPTLDMYTTNALSSITLPASSTAVIKYVYASPVLQSDQSVESKYYATDYLQSISADSPVVFSITNIQYASPYGEAVLRLGLGRNHGRSLNPTLLVNGAFVPVPADWRGYDQGTRDSFFGVLEIPVPYELLQSNNTISVEFDDAGGHISSVGLQVFEFSLDLRNLSGAIPIDYHEIVGSDIIMGFTNGPANRFFSLYSKTNLMDAVWFTNQTELPISGSGAGEVTNSTILPIQFFRIMESAPPPLPPVDSMVIEFAAPDYVNGGLDGQQNWNAESGWTVADVASAGNASTPDNSSAAVLNDPIQLEEGQTYSLSLNFEFGGTYATPANFVYAFLGGMKEDNSAASVGTGSVVADANIQIFKDADTYRLLNKYATISGCSNIAGTQLNGGDILQFDYTLSLGSDAASTFYTVRLQNLTDGTDTGVGTVTGVDASIYSALTGSGAFGFFQSISPGAYGSGLDSVQVNSVTTSISF